MARWFAAAHAIVKGVAIVGGLFGAMVSMMSAVGVVTDNGWARFLVAALVSVGGPTLLWSRLERRKKSDAASAPAPSAGLTTDTFALSLIGFTFVYVCLLHRATGGLLELEADREYDAGAYGIARCVYVLAGVTLVDRPHLVPLDEPSF